jgi:hypothetical protein
LVFLTFSFLMCTFLCVVPKWIVSSNSTFVPVLEEL